MLFPLVEIMARLRDRDTGCPWDVEQTFASIAPYTIEEAYEVADAIARDDMADLKDELGDLLLQVVFHARIAEEAGSFALKDVIDGVVAKLRLARAAMGQPETKVADLCGELGITRQTLYRFVGPTGDLREGGRRLLERRKAK